MDVRHLSMPITLSRNALNSVQWVSLPRTQVDYVYLFVQTLNSPTIQHENAPLPVLTILHSMPIQFLKLAYRSVREPATILITSREAV